MVGIKELTKGIKGCNTGYLQLRFVPPDGELSVCRVLALLDCPIVDECGVRASEAVIPTSGGREY